MTEPGPLNPEQRGAIRQRARQLRRRRHALAGGSFASILLTGSIVAALAEGRHAPRVVTVMVQPGCSAATMPVQIRVGQSASLTSLPEGWVVTSGNPGQPDSGITYSSPADQRIAAAMDRYTSYTAPSVSIGISFPSLGQVTPASALGLRTPTTTGTQTTTATIDGVAAHVQITAPPDGHPASPAYPQTETISWTPAQGTTVTVSGTNVPVPEMLQIARSATYQLGHLVELTPTPTFKLRSAAAIHALPSDHRHGATAVLSSLKEIGTVGQIKLPSTPDTRSAWLVYAPAGSGQVAWAVVDAETGAVIVAARVEKADWVYAVTDRSKPGCQPPLGVLTRTELFRGPAPTGSTLSLVTGVEAMSYVLRGQPSPCQNGCSALDWLSYQQSGGNMSVTVYDALSGEIRVQTSGQGALPEPMPQDLDPGPTINAVPSRQIASPTTATTTAIPPIVGPSPYYPGTRLPKPAPAGNGKGPNGSCNGTETYPPCGPGMVQNEYYPYTLPTNCSGYVYLDGRYWQQELYEPNQPTQNVWIVVGDNGAGWVGPGGVGLIPAPPGSPPPCGTSPASVPPVYGHN